MVIGQIRATESLPIPTRSAIVRVVQCVEVSSGVSSIVSRTTSATVPSGNHDLRPRPLAIQPTPFTPRSAKRARHRRTVSASTPLRRAISSLATPSAAHNNARDWTTVRCGNDDDRDISTSTSRCSSDTVKGAAVTTGILPTLARQTISTTDQLARQLCTSPTDE